MMQNSITILLCPVCASRDLATFYQVDAAPVTCASLFTTAAAATAVPCGAIELSICRDCGFVFNRRFDSTLAQIGAQYESSQGASGHFRAYSRSLAVDWMTRLGLAGKTILEIGCGHGEFLVELLNAGAGKAIGVDPLSGCHRMVGHVDDRLELIPTTFDEDHIGLEADAVVCRHTLEHISDVGGFLGRLSRWARRSAGRVVLFEVPASERIFSECAFWDIYYEHCSYFSRGSLRYAFARAGFDVERVQSVYSDQYFLLEARIAGEDIATVPRDVAAVQNAVLAFGDRARSAIERARRIMQALSKRSGASVIWQGASKTVGFLTALAEPAVVECAIDLSPERQNRYLPGLGLQVVSPDHIMDLQSRNVVLMNPAYYDEVKSLLRTRSCEGRLVTVNEVCDGLECEV